MVPQLEAEVAVLSAEQQRDRHLEGAKFSPVIRLSCLSSSPNSAAVQDRIAGSALGLAPSPKKNCGKTEMTPTPFGSSGPAPNCRAVSEQPVALVFVGHYRVCQRREVMAWKQADHLTQPQGRCAPVVGVEENQVTDPARLTQGIVDGDRPGGVVPDERYPIEPERVEDTA